MCSAKENKVEGCLRIFEGKNGKRKKKEWRRVKLTRFLGIFAVFRGGESDGVSDAELSRAKTSGVRAEIPHPGPSLPYGYSKRVNISPRRKKKLCMYMCLREERRLQSVRAKPCVHASVWGMPIHHTLDITLELVDRPSQYLVYRLQRGSPRRIDSLAWAG